MNIGYWLLIFYISVISLAGYWAIISSKRRHEEWKEWEKSLKVGDEVIYNGNVILNITKIDDEGIFVTLEKDFIPHKNIGYLRKPK